MKNKLKNFFWYLLLTILTLTIFCLIYKPWELGLSIPFDYRTGDDLSVIAGFKGILENGWIYHNQYLSAPFGQVLLDYPSSSSFPLLIVKILLTTSRNVFLSYNLFFILTFLLTAYSSFFVLRKYKISPINSLAGSLLFSFSTYHLYRGQQHLFLSAYFLIPIAIDLVLENFKKIPTIKPSIKENLYKLISLILISCSGLYYAFYTCLFLFFSGLVSFLKYKQLKKVIITLSMIFIIFIGILIDLIPNLVYQKQNGKNFQSTNREAVESDFYGLRIIQLFIPPIGYKIEKINNIRSIYQQNRPALLIGEGTEYLGIIGIVGLILLIFTTFIHQKDDNLKNCSSLLIMAILYGVVSGVGTIFSYIVTPGIRSNNRISILINFICLIGLLLLIKKYSNKLLNTRIKKYICFVLLMCGLIDQTAWRKPNNLEVKNEFLNDQKFIKQVEQIIPENSQIYQLPYKQYPETEPINKLSDYDLLKPYINSSNIKWSYGAIKGRIADKWNLENINLPTKDLIDKLVLLDFNGIYIDRFGYLDNGEKIETEIEKITSEKPIISDNQRFSFFNLFNYQQKYLSKLSLEETEKLKEKFLYPIDIDLSNGCYGVEKLENQSWQWCQKEGKIKIYNYGNKKRFIKLEFDLIIDPKNILITDQNNQNIDISSSKTKNHFYLETEINPGQNTLNFKTTLNQIEAKNDQRNLYFQFFNFKHFVTN